MNTQTLDDIKQSDGTLPYYAWPGGYPIIYLDNDNCVLCPKCANEIISKPDEWSELPIAYDVYYEGPDIQCEQCYEFIESAYGDPSEED